MVLIICSKMLMYFVHVNDKLVKSIVLDRFHVYIIYDLKIIMNINIIK